MARDRDAVAVAARARLDGERLLAAWQNYRAKAQALGAIVQCESVWPELLEDEGVRVQCDLIEGHDQADPPTPHRHRMLGSQVLVTW